MVIIFLVFLTKRILILLQFEIQEIKKKIKIGNYFKK